MRTRHQLWALPPEERAALEKLACSRTEEMRLVERATLILALADGARPCHVARRHRPKRQPGVATAPRVR